ncbi:ATPase domain protein, prokaryote domain protein, partial [Candidatus Thiomargarita nelsonii]
MFREIAPLIPETTKWTNNMQYPLTEKIGQPELLVGREKEFRQFQKWLDKIPDKLSKSRVILARRKSGKTVFVQRIFNQLWSENGVTIPFFFDVADTKIWYPTLAIKYYRAFASQYISFLERDEKLVNKQLSLEDIRKYGKANAIGEFVDDVDFLLQNKEVGGSHDLMWDTACSAPHRFAAFYEKRFLVIIDEFQNFTQYVYPDPLYQTAPIETLAGSFHSLSESKIAPMLVTGSYVGWLLMVIRKYLEAGRLRQIRFSPYLTEEEGLQAVYKYAQFYQEP